MVTLLGKYNFCESLQKGASKVHAGRVNLMYYKMLFLQERL